MTKKISILLLVLLMVFGVVVYAFSKQTKSANFGNAESTNSVNQNTNEQVEQNKNGEGPRSVIETTTPTQTVDDSVKVIDDELQKLSDDSLNLDNL